MPNQLPQASKIAASNGATLRELHPCDPHALEALLKKEKYEGCVVAVDGVYSMSGMIPPLAELDEVTRRYGGVLYVDDAHGTGVMGPGGRGAAYQSLGTLENVLMVGGLHYSQ